MQKRLTIERQMDWDLAFRILELLRDCPGGPTVQVQRADSPAGEAVMIFSKRTWDYLETRLRELKKTEKI